MLKEKLKMMNGVLENGNYQLGQFKFGELRKSEVKEGIYMKLADLATGPDWIIWTVFVHMPNFPPSKTPIITTRISNAIRTILTCQLFFSAKAKVTAS